MPQTFVHRDVFRRNLFARQAANGIPSTVAVDWSYPGVGAIGEELVCLVCATLVYAEAPMDDAQALESLAFEGYLAGLGVAGWSGDPRLARLGFTAGSAMVFGLGYRPFLLEESWYPVFEATFGKPMSELIPLWARFNRYVLSLAEEARQLIVEM